MASTPGVGRLLLKSALYGVAGFVLVPSVLFALFIGFGYAVDPRCGTPGDSGGCEMGAGAIALASAIPAFALFFLVSVAVAFTKRSRDETDDFETALREAENRHEETPGG